jgi:hypothetical protein
VAPYASLAPQTPLNLHLCGKQTIPLCIPTAVAADCIVVCRASLWDGHLIALPRVGLLGIQDSLEPFTVRSSVEQISPVDIRG